MSKMKRFAPWGLILSLAAALSAGGVYLVMREFNLIVKILLGLVVIGIALFALLDPERTRVSLTGRQAKHGSNMAVLTIAFVGILVVVNILVNQYSKHWDLTADKEHTLATETVQLLGTLQNPVKATAFYTSRTSSTTAKELLDEFVYNAKGKFSYTFVDPEANPAAAQEANVTRDGTIVFEMNGRKEPVTAVSEQNIATALIKLANPGERKVYFLTGHGEKDPTGSGDNSYSTAKSTLESKNYTVATLNLLSTPKIPEDATVIIVAGPEKPISAQEANLLYDFVKNGGALIAMEEPIPATQFGEDPDPLAEDLTSTWGITLGKDLVIDLTAQPETIAVTNSYGSHTITSSISSMGTIFPTSRSVQAAAQAPSESITLTTLASTSKNSWAETDLANLANNQVTADASADLMGPVPLAVAGEDSSTKGRVVVIGDSDFASDSFFNQYGNGDFFINAVDWAAEQENLISLTPKQTTERTMVLPTQYSLGLILIITVFLIPGLIVLAGIIVWIQRRKQG
jgi:ABC-type uncharacterized transport system involved in gliding motility auxiliary subunit